MTDETPDQIQRIHIDNLPPSADEDAVRALFEPFGEVFAYERPLDAQTEASGAYILLRMDEHDAGAAIAALDGHRMDGRALRVTRS